jgi:hypothetical protein
VPAGCLWSEFAPRSGCVCGRSAEGSSANRLDHADDWLVSPRDNGLRQRRIVVVVITHQAGGWQQRLNSVSESGLEGQVIVWW